MNARPVEPAPAAAVEPVWPAHANWARSGDQLSRKPGLRVRSPVRSGLSPNPGGRTAFSEPSVSDCGVAWGGPSCFRLRSGPGRPLSVRPAPSLSFRLRSGLGQPLSFQTAERPGAAPLGAPRSLCEVAPAVSNCGAAWGVPSRFQTAEGPGRTFLFQTAEGPGRTFLFSLRSGLGRPLLVRPALSLRWPPQFETAERPGANLLVSDCGAARGGPPCFRLRSGPGRPLSVRPALSLSFRLRSGLGQPLSVRPALSVRWPPQFQTAERPGASLLAFRLRSGPAPPTRLFELRGGPGRTSRFRTAGRPGASLLFSNCGAARGDLLVSDCGVAWGGPSSSSGRQTAQRPKGFWS
eukprot:tig00021569_g22336.t1